MDLLRGRHLFGLVSVLRLGETGLLTLALGLGGLKVAEEVRHAVHRLRAGFALLAPTSLQLIV